MKIIHFLLENKDAILTFIFALVFRRIEKPIVQEKTAKKVIEILGNDTKDASGISVRELIKKLRS